MQILLHLGGSERGDRYEQVRTGRGFSGLDRKSFAKLRRTVVAGKDEKVVERCDLPAKAPLRKPLVQAVENTGGTIAPGIGEKPARDVGWFGKTARAKISLGAIEPVPSFRKIRGGKSV